jgi:hypothetical protein
MLEVVDRTLRGSRNAVKDLHPSIEPLLTVLVRCYTFSWIKVAEVIGSVRYDAPIDPMRIYRVDPQRIERTVTWTSVSADLKSNEHPRFRPPKYRLAGRVFGGDWDRVDARVTDSTIYQSFVRHFEEGVPWQETEFYEETLAAIENGARPWGCGSRSELDERCRRLDELYERIAAEGYKTQNELHRSGNPTTGNPVTSRSPAGRVIWGEIAVNVGRDGELIFQDGRNRLAIAQILGLEEIPVVILVRHGKWQRMRDRIARGELDVMDVPEDLRTHPDLVDLFWSPDR